MPPGLFLNYQNVLFLTVPAIFVKYRQDRLAVLIRKLNGLQSIIP